jgi:hypothetical protein
MPSSHCQAFLEIIDDHVGELGRAILPRGDGGDVVHLLRVGDREQPAMRGAVPDGLLVVAPVERVAVPGLDEHVRRRHALRDPGRQPAAGWGAFLACHPRRAFGDEGALLVGREDGLPFGIGAAVAGELTPARPMGGEQTRRLVVHGGVDQQRRRQCKLVEQGE